MKGVELESLSERRNVPFSRTIEFHWASAGSMASTVANAIASYEQNALIQRQWHRLLWMEDELRDLCGGERRKILEEK